jgi:undecaprenyl-diphosphatase
MVLLSFWQKLLDLDRDLFEKINSDWTNPVFDIIMPFVRLYLHWAPLYLFLLVFIIINYKHNWLWWAVFFLATIALTDMTGTYIFKHNIERLRPCNDPAMADSVRLLLDRCAGGYSFISNHAANHMGMGVFFYMTFRYELKKWAWAGIIWAIIIAYSQVYVGVHYPSDVLAGALLGLVFGMITGTLFNKRFGFAIFEH